MVSGLILLVLDLILSMFYRDESFTFQAGPEVNTLHLGVFDYKTLGKDKLVGEVDIPVRD